MYDGLIKRVRDVAEEVCNDYDVDPYIAEQRYFVIKEAADAIEKLRDWNNILSETVAMLMKQIAELSKRVPPVPHGRLIEAERLKEVFHRNVASGEVFDQLIDIAPTIIEAEEGE